MRLLFKRGLGCRNKEVQRAAAVCCLACLTNLARLDATASRDLAHEDDAAAQAVAVDACDAAMEALVGAMTGSADADLVDAGLDCMRHLVDMRVSRKGRLVAAGATKFASGFLMRLCLEQMINGPNTQDEMRDAFARKAGKVLLACYDVDEGRRRAAAEKAAAEAVAPAADSDSDRSSTSSFHWRESSASTHP